MIKNYLKIAWRNLLKNKGFSAINIFGLAVGIACCLLITLYVTDELSYDKYHEKGNRIYRLNNSIKFGGSEQFLAQTPDPLGSVLKKDYPQVENFVRFFNRGPFLIKKSGTLDNIREEKILFADSSVFAVFTFPLVAGNPQTVLTEPNTIVLSETAAKRHFANENPIGQVLNLDNKKDFKVTGVMKDMPDNSHFKSEFFISMRSLDYQWDNFMANNHNTYILLKQGADPKAFEAYFNQIIEKYVSPQMLKTMGSTMADFSKSGSYYRYDMIPLTDIHLKSKYINELEANGNIQYVYIFSLVALFVLLIACINFMNLSTARSSKRTKEIGIRKVLGASVGNLWQLLSKDFVVLVAISCLIASPIAYYFMSNWLQKYAYRTDISWWIFVAAGSGALLITLLTVSFQAIKAAVANPVKSLRTE